ncbi:hypothetical protein SAMN05661096_03529 [Marivirga sericea]|uniref:Uncharacterized protein n=1 Tax=Marivirga sericea TaxID=1028 RepID=A0A1X7L518_9BACT|nr:hypothetical protein [Marivirga sericea]SMG48825.1 hypothetical protein SAMN05661096_03529 [Marivirga sericea]
MKRTSALLALLLLTNIPISCDWRCGPFTPLESKITDLSAVVGVLDSSFNFSTVESNYFNEAAIEVIISDMDYSETAAIEDRMRISFLSTAYACSPPDPQPSQAIKSIKITSDKSIYAVNRKYEAGESLNELFHIAKYSFNNEKISIADYLELQQNYLDHFAYFGDYMIFQLKDKPDSIISQLILMDYEFSDGERISIESDLFEVVN